MLNCEDYGIGQEFYEKSLDAYHEVEDINGEAYALTGIGLVLGKVGRFVDGRGYYVEALNKFKELNDKERIAIVHSLLGETYESQGAWEDAIIEYK